MTDTPSPPPGWAEAAVHAGTELGVGSAFAGMDAADWDRVCRRTGEILVRQGRALSPGWDQAMARAVGRADPAPPVDEPLAQDTADAALAEKGEVFAPEDDA
ncbi:hypothetical protein SAMN05216360_11070 [Methylobacterium phyllostachyos]|uniref:Uncharacterized protein n=1 Tax=Methylobacterium phyllostachyos TaxID=582672 RepID=A0A1H0D9L0_9HYPH|nr:hypothetical protein [Methylobacterium phyllostachyos]SDN66646.1 hypothetical protein SAMN05216360_11070 [Methylobacterium phyllostachyos]